MRTRRPLFVALCAMGLVAAPLVPARADITSVTNSQLAAEAILERPVLGPVGETPGDSFVISERPGPVNPPAPTIGVSTTELGGFPTHGDEYLIMSTGDIGTVDDANTAGNTGTEYDDKDEPPTSSHPLPQPDPGGHGSADPAGVYDRTSFQVEFVAPSDSECMRFDFKFFTEELPEATTDNALYNDQFLAIDGLNTQVAFDPQGKVVAPASEGPAGAPAGSYTAANATGTTFDAATPLLTSTAPLGPGPTHRLTFHIFDVEDSTADSAVFIDHLSFGKNCYTELETSLTGDLTRKVGQKGRYHLTVENPTTAELGLDEIELELPNGFSYVPGSTSGPTTSDPKIEDGNLVWTTEATLAPAGSRTLDLSLRAPSTVGKRNLSMHAEAGPNVGSTTKVITVKKAPSTTTVDVDKTAKNIEVAGKVKPSHPSRSVKVTLLRKKGGGFDKVDSKSANLDPESLFTTRFPRPANGNCKVVAKFEGDQHHKASSDSKTFDC